MMNHLIIAAAIYLVIINLVAFALFGSDKGKAARKEWRISEKALFLSAILGGGLGALAGMYIFHHKTKHWYFVVGIPLITSLWIVICVLIYKQI